MAGGAQARREGSKLRSDNEEKPELISVQARDSAGSWTSRQYT